MKKITKSWLDFFQTKADDTNWWLRKINLCNDRKAKIVRINGNGHVFHKIHYDNKITYSYLLYLSFLMKQQHFFYKEEQVIPYQFCLTDGELLDHQETPRQDTKAPSSETFRFSTQRKTNRNQRFSYDRRAAVNYAEHWWNSYNPKFEAFTVDCTNYVSQCLLAGGAPMRGAPVRDQGWWYEGGNWSFSWSVAHSMRWYLSGSTTEVQTANELYPGDIICYDFQGDGRWDHNTIVVAKDTNGMPLVNAHTDNSRHRYWSYEDSTAWTPNIKYKFFRIGE